MFMQTSYTGLIVLQRLMWTSTLRGVLGSCRSKTLTREMMCTLPNNTCARVLVCGSCRCMFQPSPCICTERVSRLQINWQQFGLLVNCVVKQTFCFLPFKCENLHRFVSLWIADLNLKMSSGSIFLYYAISLVDSLESVWDAAAGWWRDQRISRGCLPNSD